MEKVGTLLTKSMTILDATNENRFFEGYLTVEMKDKQGEITIVDELYKVLPLWMDRGAPITDTHSNRVVGKGINFMKTEFESEGVTYPAIKITGKIHKNYELDTDIWEKIKSGEYRGLSFGGATKADRTPKVMKDGDVAYALTDLEHYEVAVCKDPAVPLALITDHNPLAKAMVPSVPRGDGKEIIKCTNFGCYVEKGEDWSNADITPATATNTVSQSTQTAKPVKIDSKVGDTNELDGGMKVKPTPLEGGIQKESPATTGTKGAVRGLMNTSQQGSGETSLITTETEGVNNPLNSDKKVKKYSDEAVHKVAGAILAGAARLGAGIAEGVANEIDDTDDEIEKTMTYRNTPANVEMKYPEEGEEVWDSKQQKQVKEDKTPNRTNQLESKSAYQTEDGNNQLGGQAEPDEKLVSAMGAQNKQNTSKEVEN